MNNKYFKIGILLFSTITAMFSFYAWQILKTPNFNVKEGKDYELFIDSTDTYDTVFNKLQKDSVIIDVLSFKFLSKVLNLTEKVHEGRYLIGSEDGNLKIINKLRRGTEDPYRLIINSWRTKEDFAGKIAKQIPLDSNQILHFLDSSNYCNELGFTPDNILTLFIPNTYFIYYSKDFKDLVKRMQKEYGKFWTKTRIQQAKALGFTPTETTILASIVEGESKKSSEQSRIAGVYYNRLKANMPLQADPTVVFALKDFTIKRVNQDHIRFRSPYNTYINKGLPPGPISIPNIEVIDKVLNLEKNQFYYFCANPDFSGTHLFAKDYAEHLKNAKLYQDALDKNKIHSW